MKKGSRKKSSPLYKSSRRTKMEEEEEEAVIFPFQLAEEPIISSNDNEDDDDEDCDTSQTRKICANGCYRPAKVCLCSHLPPKPIPTSTQIIILQHPHELRHKLATVPILTKCLLNSQTLIARRLSLGSIPILDSLYASSVRNPNRLNSRAIFLFPGSHSSPSIELTKWVSLNNDAGVESRNLVLIVFDGTWKHAKEMVAASLPFLSKFATQACLNYDVGVDGDTIFDSDLVLRKEPFSGCVSTIEAVARALRVLESESGVETESKLISVLRAMVKFQACHLKFKTIKPRVKLLKKGKEKEPASMSDA